MEAQTTLNQRIDDLIKARNFSQMNVAKQLSVSKQTVSNWVSGNVQIPVKHLVELVKLFQPVSSDWLLLGVGEMAEIAEKSPEEDTNIKKLTGQVELLKEIIQEKEGKIEELQREIGELSGRK